MLDKILLIVILVIGLVGFVFFVLALSNLPWNEGESRINMTIAMTFGAVFFLSLGIFTMIFGDKYGHIFDVVSLKHPCVIGITISAALICAFFAKQGIKELKEIKKKKEAEDECKNS
ncbi:MAG: hypothetical protein PHE59_01230 [Patescibacteria group bacterium]|nr:hypothetical protein [Patescibacteria group bacterium]MDD5535025.1 hypothetical protein [Patescibacteria group bacterium]